MSEQNCDIMEGLLTGVLNWTAFFVIIAAILL